MTISTDAAPDGEISFTYFTSYTDSIGERRTAPFDQLCDWIATHPPMAATKGGLPLIKLATFVDNHRKNEKLEAVFGIEGDYDGEALHPYAASALLAAKGIQALIYTSPSHQNGAPRWRVVCPLSNPVAAEERHELTSRLNSALGGILAPESFVASQSYYVGSVTGGEPVKTWRVDGLPLDLVEGLKPVGPPEAASGFGGKRIQPGEGRRAPNFEIALAALQSRDPSDFKSRREWLLFSGSYCTATHGFPDAKKHWMAWNEPYENNDPAANSRAWHGFERYGANGDFHTLASMGYDPAAKALAQFGDGPAPMPQLPFPPGQKPVHFLDDGSGCKIDRLVSSEIYLLLRDNIGTLIGFNEFSGNIVKRGPMPWDPEATGRPWTATDDAYLRAYIQRGSGKSPPTEALNEAIVLLADRNKFDPIADRLNELQWDGVPRLDSLPLMFTAKNADFARIALRKVMISIVARVFQPGCKVDTVLVLEGEQGTGKSTAAAILAGGDDYFSDHLPPMHEKDAAAHLQGKLIVEIAELSAMRRSDVEEVKAFISRRTDKFRPAYGKHDITCQRRCVFIATTNSDEYLHDDTGNRRFWPVKISGNIDLAALEGSREQLFAEAVVAYRQGEPWYFSAAEAALAQSEQSERVVTDSWQEPIRRFCASNEVSGQLITMERIVSEGLRLPYQHQNTGVTKRVKSILRTLGFRPTRNATQRWYERKPQ
ncbi:virulence-associated E family protein [Pelagibacterium nitratireducens]|uniref:Virulence-associated E family protein n=1 Tax=Pelagibacterium nitratireducens TaxID=1046114 RepID=A0ABZ2HYH9_9HYPH